MSALLAFYAFAIGAIVGSFLNVVIHRYPREESIVFPGSHCPHCNALIKPYDNVPILSWIWLRGRCRHCRAPISLRYPLLELANALFYLAIEERTGATAAFLPIAAIVSMTIVLIYIDLDIQILPDVIDIPGMAIGLGIGALGIGEGLPTLVLASSWTDSALGAAFGAAILVAIMLAYWLIRRVEGMGLGDVKMLAMIGAVLGWGAIFPVLLIASISGSVVGLVAAARSERRLAVALPFGVFLGLATLVVLFFGRQLTAAYAGLLMR
jgi:leader peptidase (prepilin peptidase) / N-methyltransferase